MAKYQLTLTRKIEETAVIYVTSDELAELEEKGSITHQAQVLIDEMIEDEAGPFETAESENNLFDGFRVKTVDVTDVTRMD